jgi:hypothetical protein
MIVAAHQPDLLPYSGFFYKLAKADIFDLKIWDQYVQRGFQRRVKMRDKWVGVPVITDSSTAPIDTLRIDPDRAPAVLVDGIRKSYRDAKHWDKYGPMICDEIMATRTELLWQFNLALILMVRDILGIRTPVSLGIRHTNSGSAGVVEALQAFGTPTYLSGTGAKVYMGDCKEFADAGMPVIFSKHEPITGDSILTVLMDHDDPKAVVLAEHEENGRAA